jgi:two-component system LytT family response regulator
MSDLRVIFADDELVARKRLRRLLSALPDVSIVAECTDGEEVLSALEAHDDVDVLLLDIHMPGLTGLETKALIADDGPYVIFATAHPEHALEAFDVGAVDYVLKPIEAGRLKKALDRARAADAPRERTEGPPRLALPTRDGARLLDPARISHAVFDGSLVTVHYAGEELLTELTLTDLETRLPAGDFERVHRRALLNLARVDRLVDQPTGGYVAVTEDGLQVEVSRQAARKLRKRLGLR